ncbi:MAG: hypothetical protein JXR37_31435 [Kiritimatiellae bacterium]|nr:hypothetical protein [Kiritimatiellia bacterium]
MRDENAEQIWAYVHGELAPAARAALDEALQQDSGLRGQVAAATAMDRRLRRLMPMGEWTDEDLTGRILAQWERDSAHVDECPRTDERPVPSPEPPIPFPGRRRLVPGFGRLAIGLAAALLIAVGVVRFRGSPPRWAPPEFAAPQYRGAGSQTQYTAETARTASSLLRAAVARSARRAAAAGEPLRGKWALSLRFEELQAGAFRIEIHAREARTGSTQKGAARYEDLPAFRAAVDELGDEIVARLLDTEAGGAGNDGQQEDGE